MKGENFDVAFSIGSFTVYWYALLLALGIAAGVTIMDLIARKRKLAKDVALDLCILSVPCGLIGARLFACLSGQVPFKYFINLTFGGFNLYGALLLCFIACYIYTRIRKIGFCPVLDAAAPGLFLGIGIASWGDFFNRSNYGPLVNASGLKWFPMATYAGDLSVHYAVFFYEFLLCVAIAALAYFVFYKRGIFGTGKVFAVSILLYSVGSFFLDWLRMEKIMAGALAFDQWCEMAIAIASALWIFLGKSKPMAEPAEEAKTEPEEAVAEEKPEEPEKAKEEEKEDPDLQKGEEKPEEARDDNETGLA